MKIKYIPNWTAAKAYGVFGCKKRINIPQPKDMWLFLVGLHEAGHLRSKQIDDDLLDEMRADAWALKKARKFKPSKNTRALIHICLHTYYKCEHNDKHFNWLVRNAPEMLEAYMFFCKYSTDTNEILEACYQYWRKHYFQDDICGIV